MKWESLTFSYGEKKVLTNATLTLPDRSVVGLMGASGSGKTTLLRLLCGLESAVAVTVKDPPGRISVLFQEDRLFPHLTVLRNLTLILKDEAAASEWLGKVGLSDVSADLPAALSGGMKRRVALARALATPADLVLLDEPFNGLDGDLRLRMGDLIRETARDRTVLVSLHSETDAERICDRILILRDGQIFEKE